MKKNLETICVQGGWKPKNGDPRVLPIYQSTTFKYSSTEEMADLFDLKAEGYFYTRLANPTNDAVAAKINDLEGGVGCVLTSSGQAANFYAIFNICQAGDHFITSNTIYGGTFNLFGVTLKKLGIECTFVDPDWSDEQIEAVPPRDIGHPEQGCIPGPPRSLALRDARSDRPPACSAGCSTPRHCRSCWPVHLACARRFGHPSGPASRLPSARGRTCAPRSCRDRARCRSSSRPGFCHPGPSAIL